MVEINTPFPHAARRDLADPPIELIIGQIKFPALAELFTNDGFVRYATEVRSEYPNAAPDSTLRFASEAGSEPMAVPIWRFEDLAKRFTLTLTPDFIALETRSYESFSSFREQLVSAWRRLVSLFTLQHRTRLGLRYVDRFADDKQKDLPQYWPDLIESGIFPMRSRDGALRQSGQLAHTFAITDALMLTFRAAFRHPGVETAGREFVLDLDCFDPTRGGTDDIEPCLNRLKEVTHNAFWWTFRRLLDEVDPPNAIE